MSKKKDEDEERLAGVGAAYAIGGPGLAGAYALGGVLGERDSKMDDFGPAPIGSDPWLVREVRRAVGREVDASAIEVEAHEAIVTLRGKVPSDLIERITRAARTVEGIARLEVDLQPAG